MKKCDLIRTLADKTDLTGTAVESVLDALAAEVTTELSTTGSSSVPGICRLSVETLKERNYRNPRTGETILKPARRKVKIVPFGKLSAAILEK